MQGVLSFFLLSIQHYFSSSVCSYYHGDAEVLPSARVGERRWKEPKEGTDEVTIGKKSITSGFPSQNYMTKMRKGRSL